MPVKPPSPIVILAVSLALALALGIIVSLIVLPIEDVQHLLLYMLITGSFTLAAVYLVYRRRALQWVSSVRWMLLATSLLAVLLVFVNVYITARLMFISERDLVLTSALLVFAGTISGVSTYLISSTMVERIRVLSESAGLVAKGHFHTRIFVEGRDEIAQLSEMFNKMAVALETLETQKGQAEQSRRDFITWVSHDLRTPIASVRALNEAMLDGVVADSETVKRYHQTIAREIQHLTHLIDDLFELSQLDSGRVALVRQSTSIHDLISDTLGTVQARTSENVILTGMVEPGLPMADIAPDKIQRVLYNLLDNALHHTPPGGSIHLGARDIDGKLQIRVHNTGSYIAPEDLPHIFTHFYRAERSRSQSSSGYRGTGLGLAIARGFLEAHDGILWAESDPQVGTTFIFELPFSRP